MALAEVIVVTTLNFTMTGALMRDALGFQCQIGDSDAHNQCGMGHLKNGAPDPSGTPFDKPGPPAGIGYTDKVPPWAEAWTPGRHQGAR